MNMDTNVKKRSDIKETSQKEIKDCFDEQSQSTLNPVLVTCIKIGFRTTRYKSVPPYVQRQYCLSEPKKSKIKFQLVS